VGALALGLARDALERAVVYAQQRQVAGGSLFDQALTRAKLSRMEENLWVAWQAVRAAAKCAAHSEPFKVQAYMAKVFATETALRITDEAIQILGGYGYMRDYKVEQNYRDARLLTIGEGASEILRFAIAGNLLDKTPGPGDVLAPLDNLRDAAGPSGGSMSDIWGPSWRALQLAAEALDLVREQIELEGQRADSAAAWQCKAVAFADLATQLWVAKQVMLSGTRLVNQGRASQKRLKLVRTFLVNSSIEICHQALEFLRTVGLHDARVFSNYLEAAQIGATANSSSQVP
jgi:alkylation response protein AidB-like acyl-CoA dehydrogenase